MKFLRAEPPKISADRVQDFVARAYGLRGRLTPLYSDRDQNFMLREATGPAWVVKVANVSDDLGTIECQLKALRHIASVDPALPVPRVRPASDGNPSTILAAGDGSSHIVFVLSFIEGSIAGNGDLDPRLLFEAGALQARLGRALRGFFHPAAARELLWDVRSAPQLAAYAHHLPEKDRRIAEDVLADFTSRTLPRLPALRAQVVHADTHGHNLIVSPEGRAAGLIDFGDMVHGPLILDLTNALADFMTSVDRIEPVLRNVFAGFTSVTPLEPEERELVPDLVLARFAVSALVNAYRAAETPQEHNYLAASGFGALDVVEELRRLGPQGIERLSTGASVPPPQKGPGVGPMLARRREVLGPHLYLFYDPPLHIVRGEGVWLWDASGRRFMDCYNNVPIVGHCHPHVVEAISRQIRVLNTNTRYLGEEVLAYAERLTTLTGGALSVAAFVNSGSEANDLAWRMSKAWTGAAGALTQEFAYHGITDAIDAVSPSANKRGTLAPHVRTLLAPDPYRGIYRRGSPDLGARYAEDADHAIRSLAGAGLKPAAYFLDSAFMTNGILEPQAGYVAHVFEKVRAAGGLCIADEVQAGFGRMGDHFWGYRHHGVVPDIVTIGKPAGNGHPIGVVITRPEIYEKFSAETAFFSTFGGNNVSSAAGLAVIEVIEGEDLVANAKSTGAYLKAGLQALMTRHEIIGDVRGTGLAFGIELVTDRRTLTPAKAETDRLINLLRDEGLLVGSEGVHGNIVKMRPPMTFNREHAGFAITAFERALSHLRD